MTFALCIRIYVRVTVFVRDRVFLGKTSGALGRSCWLVTRDIFLGWHLCELL